MARQLNLTVNKIEYENRASASRLGHAYTIKDEQGDLFNNHNDISQFEAIDKALYNVLKRAAMHYYEADVTIEGASLSDGLKTFLSDKYTVEAQISSITFA